MALATQPQGDLEGLGVFDLPPLGWSTGFLAIPLTSDLWPRSLALPAEPSLWPFQAPPDKDPSLQILRERTRLTDPEGSLRVANKRQWLIKRRVELDPGALAQKWYTPLEDRQDTGSPGRTLIKK